MNVYKIVFQGVYTKQTLFMCSSKQPTREEAMSFVKGYGFEEKHIYDIQAIEYWKRGN